MLRFWYFEDALISRVASQKAEVRCGQQGLLLVQFSRVRVGVSFLVFFDQVNIFFRVYTTKSTSIYFMLL
jgi:hypothetical protein